MQVTEMARIESERKHARSWSDANVSPLWENRLAHGGSAEPPRPMLWSWSTMQPLIQEATTIKSMEAIERRVLSLVDPAYADNGSATVRNLNAGLQILLPGEIARPHRHSMNAIRFAIAADGNGNMSAPAAVRARKTTGELRPYEYAAGFWGGQSPRSWSVSCRANRAGRRGARKPAESSGGDSHRRVIWGIPANIERR